ncbi:MAG: hypothetical protein AAGE52_08690 [Myxococcota bacterium]
MEMTPLYMNETAQALASHGFKMRIEATDYGDEESVPATRYHLDRPGERLILETVIHPEVGELYYLEIVNFHGLQSASFQLDSWKFRPDRVELKYQPTPEGTGGLSLILRLDVPDE